MALLAGAAKASTTDKAMFKFFRNKESSSRKGLRMDFEKVTTMLRGADDRVQMAVGHSINMVNSMFIERFQSLESFRGLPESSKMDYIATLTDFENRMTQEDPHMALGCALFKMWIGAVTANDEELFAQFSDELAFFSRKGELPP